MSLAGDLLAAVWVATDYAECEGCHELTKVRFGDGDEMRIGHFGCLSRMIEVEPVVIAPPAATLRFLDDLMGEKYRPRKLHEGKLVGPYWRPPLPEVADLVEPSGWAWSRPAGGVEVAVLDRNGAHHSSAASVLVAHGPLEQTGPDVTGRPGLYKMPWAPWTESLPHPLGGAARIGERTGSVWVVHTRAELLWQLAREGRYPECEPLDSYTCEAAVRLDKWTKHLSEIRAVALTKYGADSDQYGQFKNAYSQAITLMIGTRERGGARRWKSKVHRPDWGWAVQELSSVTLWRWCDELTQLAHYHGHPEWAPVGMRAVDELLVPSAAVDWFTATERLGGKRPLRIDPTGLALGTFKIKGLEVAA